MKLFDSLLLSIGVALVIIGIYEIMTRGLVFAYAFLMPAIIIFLWLVYRRRSNA